MIQNVTGRGNSLILIKGKAKDVFNTIKSLGKIDATIGEIEKLQSK
jgi:hypothetical protein